MRHTTIWSLRAGVLAALLAGALLVLAACGGDEGVSTTAQEAATSEPADEAAPVVLADRVFTIDDVVAAGWKKSKQFSTETVPQAAEVWYGFHNRKDIEVRVYASHKDAVEHGTESAEAAVDRGARGYGAGGDLADIAGTMRARYADYLIVGNLVILCEDELLVCQNLADQME